MESPLIGDFYPHGIQEALGNVVVLWSNIEGAVGEAILSLGELNDLPAARMMLYNMDIRSRLSALKAVCYMAMRPDDFSEAEKWLNHIDGDLRNYRNRLIHDEWSTDISQLVQGDMCALRNTIRTKIIQEPPTGKKVLQLSASSTVYAEDISEFCRDLDDARAALLSIHGYEIYKSPRRFAEKLPPISYRHKSGQRHP
jgi:hypothetical protein